MIKMYFIQRFIINKGSLIEILIYIKAFILIVLCMKLPESLYT